MTGWRRSMISRSPVGSASAPTRQALVGIAVHGVGRPVVGRVGDRVAVVGGGHDRSAELLGHGLVGAGLVREDLEALIGRVVRRDLVGPFGVAGLLADRAPALGPLAVGVGDHQVGARAVDRVEAGAVGGVGRGEEVGLRPVEQAERGRVRPVRRRRPPAAARRFPDGSGRSAAGWSPRSWPPGAGWAGSGRSRGRSRRPSAAWDRRRSGPACRTPSAWTVRAC